MGGTKAGKGTDRRDKCPCMLAPSSPPEKNSDSDKVPSGNQTHAKVWLIKHHFWKTTQIYVIFMPPNIKQQPNLRLPWNIQKLIVFQLQPDLPNRGSTPGPHYGFLIHTTIEQCWHLLPLCALAFDPTLPPSFKILVPPMQPMCCVMISFRVRTIPKKLPNTQYYWVIPIPITNTNTVPIPVGSSASCHMLPHCRG